MNKVTALSVLSNDVLVWNSVQFAESVEVAAIVERIEQRVPFRLVGARLERRADW